MNKALFLAGILTLLTAASCHRPVEVKTEYVDSFDNVNHPEVAYWFFTPDMMQEATFQSKIDNFVQNSKYTLVYLTAREGCDFYDVPTMHPVFMKLVDYAHRHGLKIGLQIWKNDAGTPLEHSDCLIQEGEVTLDKSGAATYSTAAKGARNMNSLLKSGLFKIYAFKKTGDGFYDPSTLKEITGKASTRSTVSRVDVSVHAGPSLKGYTAYILTRHYYHSCSNFTDQAVNKITGVFSAYSDIPFDAIGLDEYKNMTIVRQPVLRLTHDVFRERLYSGAMAVRMKKEYGADLDRLLFDMRYAPEGNPVPRIRAINEYMSLLRTSTLAVEAAMYDTGKKLYGEKTFIGLHNTFHNNLDGDEVWQTGVSWWNIKRDYGHTDEETPVTIQLGIGMCNTENAMYNMYYNKSLDRIWTKALYDLRYGVRTHYHAANDVQGWGVSIDEPDALAKINKVENAARLMNRFDPPFPAIKLLVVFGMEAIYDWYPDAGDRGLYDINDKLNMDGKSMELWENGYLNVAVPSDAIEDGRLHLNADGKPELHGYTFDAIIFLNPQYSKESTLHFLQDYVDRGGKLLVEGRAGLGYDGRDVSKTWEAIAEKATALSFSPENVRKLGIPKNPLKDGVANGNGIFTFTNIESLQSDKPAVFTFTYNGHTFSGTYKGIAVIQVNEKGKLEKLSATAFSTLNRDKRELLHLTSESDIFLTSRDDGWKAIVDDKDHRIKVLKYE